MRCVSGDGERNMAATADSPKLKSEPAAVIPTAALEVLAARFRPSGLFVCTLHPDGSVNYHDPNASVFFQRYVLPILQWRESIDLPFRECLDAMTPTTGIVAWRFIPGVLMAAFPY